MLKNGVYNVVGAVLRLGLGLLTIPLLIHLIGIEEYGLWMLVSTAVSLVSLAETGLSVSTTVFLSRDLANKDAEGMSQTLTVTFSAMLLLATLAALGLWVSAGAIADLFPNLGMAQRGAAVQALQIGGLVVWARLIQQILIGVEQAYQRYGLMNVLMTLQSVLISLGLLGVVGLGWRTVELMQWQAVASFAVLLAHAALSWLLVRHMQPRLAWNSVKGIKVVRYSLMTWAALLGGALFSHVDRLIVGAMLGTRLLGIYVAITSVTSQINSFSALPVQPLLPTLSNQVVKSGSQSLIVQQVKQALEINTIVALGTGSILFTLAPFVMQVIVSDAITDANILAFRIAALIYTLYSLNAVGYYILFGVNATKICMVIQLLSGFTSLLLIGIGSSISGLLGAIVGNAGYLGVWGLTYWGMKQLGIPLSLWVKWLYFPIIWFILVIILNVLIADQIIFKVVLAAIQSAIIIGWFITVQHTKLKLLVRKMVTR